MSLENQTRLDLSDLESALGALTPMPVDRRDQILYQAGAASVQRREKQPHRHLWPALAAGFATIALGEAAMLARRPVPEVFERVVVIREPAQPIAAPPVPGVTEPLAPPTSRGGLVELSARDRLTDQVVRYGLDGLPPQSPIDHPTNQLPLLSGRDLLRQEIRNSLSAGG